MSGAGGGGNQIIGIEKTEMMQIVRTEKFKRLWGVKTIEIVQNERRTYSKIQLFSSKLLCNTSKMK